MMYQLRYYLTNPRTLIAIGLVIVIGLVLLGPNALKAIAFWVGVALFAALLVLLVMWVIKKVHARKSSEELGEALTEADTTSAAGNKRRKDADLEAIHERMRDAVKSIKGSRLGQTRGSEALYELPWYMIIGNPAAGKSTAIANSGLRFPFAEEHGTIIQGIGGTRNCDWYFTSEGILLDTAGRYSVHDENRSEWMGFLDLLRKHRPRAPINGIIIAASIAELTGNKPEFGIELAKKLRKRVQELTDCLEVIAPVYVVFTKADLIAGFSDFFRGLDDDERHRVWGATLPFHADDNEDVVDEFDRHFDELSEGLKEMSLAQMSLNRGNALAPGMLTLPLEFTGIKSSLRTFIATLFEDNPYQYRPVFRGFYFTSALQESASVRNASDQITRRFHLTAPPVDATEQAAADGNRSYFLLDLFRKVVFADKQLVRQHSSKHRKRARYGMLIGSALALGLVMGGWAWSYTNNRQLVSNVRADLAHAKAIQKDRVDLQSRLEALQILQDRLQQLQTYRSDHPLMLGLGLYQGNAMEGKLRHEYFHGMRQIMLEPVTQNLETYLANVVKHGDQLQTVDPTKATAAGKRATTGAYQTPSPTDTQEAYNALKAYLMLSHPDKVEPVQLSDQLTRFWRNWLEANRGMMSRNTLIASAQKLMTFYIAQYDQPGWPTVDDQVVLVQDARTALRHVMRGMSAIDRVYAQVKARAATRFPAVTVASILGDKEGSKLLAGSYAIPGPFTHEAWEGYVKDAIKNAANNELSVKDWVLQSSRNTDLTLNGSPEQIQKQLEAKYDRDYVTQWQHFLKGISVKRFDSFAQAVKAMNTLGDPQNSPIRLVLQKVYEETSWDNPSPVGKGLKSTKGGFVSWFKRVILRRSVHGNEVNEALSHARSSGDDASASGTGPIGGAFTGVARIMQARDSNPAVFDNYMSMLGKLRTRLNAINTRGNPEQGARKLMAGTLGGKAELSQGLHLVDERMLNGLSDSQRRILRPLLLRPLMQTFRALVTPAESDVNKIWMAQVYKPFQENLAGKYPFDENGRIQATGSEMQRIFGPTGAIATFVTKTLGPLVNQRGDTLTAKQWADMGITLNPAMMAQFGRWTAPLGQTGMDGHDNRTVFQVQPQPATGEISGYTINIDGQTLRYRNTPPHWKPFVWGISRDTHIAEVHATTLDGRDVTLERFTGADALPQLFRAGQAQQDSKTGIYTLTWNHDHVAVTVRLKIISSPNVNGDGTARRGLVGTQLPSRAAGATMHTADTGNRQTGDKS